MMIVSCVILHKTHCLLIPLDPEFTWNRFSLWYEIEAKILFLKNLCGYITDKDLCIEKIILHLPLSNTTFVINQICVCVCPWDALYSIFFYCIFAHACINANHICVDMHSYFIECLNMNMLKVENHPIFCIYEDIMWFSLYLY